ncbi:HTH domain-containing protein [Leuconostocaceae bacterium ESL0958]|nr:HTH domain-containing protein [Leuconostocaceae bacterium ESL0958]
MPQKKVAYNDKERILRLYSILISKQALSVDQIEDMFFVGRKTVQRDIKAIRDFLADMQAGERIQSEIVFNRTDKKYHLTEREHLFEVFDRINEEGGFF